MTGPSGLFQASMAAITSNFCLYSLTLRPSSAVTTSVVGVFAGGKPNDQLLLSAVGSRLNLYRPNASTPFHSTDVFGTIRCLAPFRLYGMPKGESAPDSTSQSFSDCEKPVQND